MVKLADNVLFTLDQAFRSYHQFAQQRVRALGFKITIDQWLVLKTVADRPNLNQKELAEVLGKDAASITRILQHLVKNAYLKRKEFKGDRRRTILELTDLGNRITCDVEDVAVINRAVALKGLTEADIIYLRKILSTIIDNTSK